jgi:hypothetical protein
MNTRNLFGGLNDVRVYNRILTQAEITVLSTFPTATALSKANREEVTVNIFPNPTNGQITIDTDESLYNSNFIVRNLLGQIVKQGVIETNHQTIHIDGPEGVYFLEVVTPSETKMVKKVIKN